MSVATETTAATTAVWTWSALSAANAEKDSFLTLSTGSATVQSEIFLIPTLSGSARVSYCLVLGRKCQCRTLLLTSPPGPLLDINECLNYPRRLCAHNCENTEGSYRCSCTSGFKLSHDKRSCEGRQQQSQHSLGTHDLFVWIWKENLLAFIWTDIDECEASPCQHECMNTYGSYSCYCRPGYTLSRIDGISCNGNASTALLITKAKLLGLGRCCGYCCCCCCWPHPNYHTPVRCWWVLLAGHRRYRP